MTGARAAIVGFGGMGQRHFKAYRAAGVEVAALCDVNPEAVRRAAPDFPADRVFTDPEKMWTAVRPDVLSVVSNGPTHAALSTAAIRAGVPRVLCEKPMATNLRDAKALLAAARERGARLAVNHIRRWSPSYDAVRKAIGEGAIGRLRHIYFHSGSTGLGNFAVHAFDTMRLLFQCDPDWVQGTLDRTGTPNPRGAQFKDPAGYGVLHFQNGARAFVDTCEDTGVQYQYTLVGEYGRFFIDELNDVWTLRARSDADRALPLTRYGSPMPSVPFQNPVPFDIVDLTSRAIRNLLSDEPLRSPGEDGLRSLEMVLAFHVSDREGGARVPLPLDPRHDGWDVPIA